MHKFSRNALSSIFSLAWIRAIQTRSTKLFKHFVSLRQSNDERKFYLFSTQFYATNDGLKREMERKEKKRCAKGAWAMSISPQNDKWKSFIFFNEILSATGNLSSLKTKPMERRHGYRLKSIVFCATPNTNRSNSTFSECFQAIGAYFCSM